MNVRSVFLLVMSLFLTGCVAAVVAGAAAGGIVVYDKRGVLTLEKDARIFHVVHKDIVTDRRFSGSRIVVISFNRVVLLVGQTPAASLRVLAEKIAQRTQGVRRVYDEVSIGYPISVSRQTKDTWITGQIRSKMLARKGLESGQIRVVTENANVYLMGIVTPDQADMAVSVARKVPGVNKVVKVFQYIR